MNKPTYKKLLVTISGMVAVLLAYYFDVPEDVTLKVTIFGIAYILGQGMADTGNEAVKDEKKNKRN